MRTMTPNNQHTDPRPYTPPPVEWSADHTARMVARLAADVAKIRKWIVFWGILTIIWLAVSALVMMTTIGALSDASS